MVRFVAFVLALLSLLPAQATAGMEEQLHQHVKQLQAGMVREAAKLAQPSSKVSALVKKMNLLDIEVFVIPDNPFGVGMYFPGAIVLDSRVEEESEEYIAYLLAHEYGHHLARHWAAELARAASLSSAYGISSPQEALALLGEHRDPATSHRHEFEADAYAKQLLEYNKLWSPDAVRRVLTKGVATSETPTHPARDARLKAMGIPM